MAMVRRRAKPWLLLWFVLGAVWIGGVTHASLRSWPQMPLDLSSSDPQTKKAYNEAVNRYIGRVALVAIVPPVLLIALGLVWYRLSSSKS